MCFCLLSSHRVNCILSGIFILLITGISASFTIYRGNYETHNCMLLTGLIATFISASCLILGALLKMRILVLVWIVMSLPATLLVVTAYGLIMHEKWAQNSTFSNSLDVVSKVSYICMILFSVCNALLFLRTISHRDI